MHRLGRALVMAGLLCVPAAGCIAEPTWRAQSEPLPFITARPNVPLLFVQSVGPISRPLSLVSGKHVVSWFVTAGETDCRIGVVLDGPAGSVVVDEYGRVAARQSAGSNRDTGGLDAGAYTLRLDTDCPGESYLSMSRYLD